MTQLRPFSPSYALLLKKHEEAIAAASPIQPYIFQTCCGIYNYVGINIGGEFSYITRDGSENYLHRTSNLPCHKTIADAEIIRLKYDKNGNRRAKISVESARLGFLKFEEICEIMKSMGWRFKEGYFYGQWTNAEEFIGEYINRAKYGV